MSTRIITAALVVALLTGVTFATAPVAADTDTDSVLEGVLGDDDRSLADYASAAAAGFSGASDRALYWIQTSSLGETFDSLAPEETSPAEEAAALETAWNANRGDLESYANARDNWTSDHVVEIVIRGEEATARRYLVATSSNGTVSAEMVESTNQTVTDDVQLCGYAATQAHDELAYFVDEYAEEDEDVDAAYLARIKGRYGDDVETSLYPSAGDCGGD